jgi:hypothetical protein
VVLFQWWVQKGTKFGFVMLVQGKQQQGPKKVAICLVGGLRAFELTGPSIKKYLLDVYDDADLFIHSPIDQDIHKLSVLSGAPRLASVKLFTPSEINETFIAKEVLSAAGSPNGIQVREALSCPLDLLAQSSL